MLDIKRTKKQRTKKQLASQSRFGEYRRFSDAYSCTFREWLDIRKMQWYDDLKNEPLKPCWEE